MKVVTGTNSALLLQLLLLLLLLPVTLEGFHPEEPTDGSWGRNKHHDSAGRLAG